MGKNRQIFHDICNASNKLAGRPELCQLPTNLIQHYPVMYDSMCLGLGYCFTYFLRNIVPVDFYRVIMPFLNNIFPVYFMTHIVPVVKSKSIGNILFLKALVNLAFILFSFRLPVILDVYHLTCTPLQIQVTFSHSPYCLSEW